MRSNRSELCQPAGEDRETGDFTITFGLTDGQYTRLHWFVTNHESETGECLTYQAIMEAALSQYLDERD